MEEILDTYSLYFEEDADLAISLVARLLALDESIIQLSLAR